MGASVCHWARARGRHPHTHDAVLRAFESSDYNVLGYT